MKVTSNALLSHLPEANQAFKQGQKGGSVSVGERAEAGSINTLA